ncbi:hypothetical protein Hbl1158_12870 [Halobaculum sp. CBA1158]|uniref:hypothetical protein n=1 Tax=Halobaculum sp. CBA1158 TaxID=2904243 RepID=UPI001F3B89E2|nr:hypothetical protein [Halobaculum sp. CBA1158]UIO99407.1 hypothetical protein Hbl1158_12870 [Halobaculum sp. CBA1158]
MDRRTVVLAVACATLLAGCGGVAGGGVAGGDVDDRATVNPALAGTPTASPTPTPAPSYPPGVDADGVDVETLIAEHNEALWRTSSAVRFSRTVVAANGTTLATRRSVTESDDERVRYRVEVDGAPPGSSPPGFASFAFWTNGSVTVVQSVDDAGNASSWEVSSLPETDDTPDDSGEDLLIDAFAGTEPRLVNATAVDGEELSVLRVEHERLNRTDRRPLRNVSGTLYVTDEGVVREYRLRYTATYDTESGPVTATTTERFRVTVGDATATAPDWVTTATD